MTKALYTQGEVDASSTSVANTTEYWYCGAASANIAHEATEANAQILHKNAGTFSNLTFSLSANTISGGSTVFTFRKNGVDGNMTISVPASSSGNFSEATAHTDTVVSGDKTALKSVPGAATGTVTMVTLSTTFLNTSSTDTITRLTNGSFTGGFTLATASTTDYEGLAGEIASTASTTEANSKIRIRKAGTIKNAAVFVRTNARTTNTTFTIRKNAVDTAMVITVGSGVTGWVEFTSSTVSVAAGDDVNWSLTTGTGTQTLLLGSLLVDFVTTDGWFPIISSTVDNTSINDATTAFMTLAGYLASNATEATVDEQVSTGYIFAELTALITANDVSSASTVTLMDNAVATALSASITASTTGVFSDSTNVVLTKASDKLDIKIAITSVSGVHSTTIKNIVLWGKEPTRLYFHNATTTDTGTLPTTVQSALGAPSQSVDAATVNRSMDGTIGTAQTTKSASFTSGATKQYFTRFVSSPLDMTAIAANTWYYSFAAAEAILTGNFPCSGAAQVVNVTLYVWRPSTGAKVGNILDGNSAAKYNEPTAISTITSEFGTFTGSAVSSMVTGDILCLEVYFSVAPTQASTNTFYYDGTTETLATGTTVTSHASFIATPEALVYAVAGGPIAMTNSSTLTFANHNITKV